MLHFRPVFLTGSSRYHQELIFHIRVYLQVGCRGRFKTLNSLAKRILSDWFSAALKTSRKCERYKNKKLNIHKKRLLALLTIEVVLIILDKITDKPSEITDSFFSDFSIFSWSSLVLFIAIVIYAFTLSCNHCGARQVLRGISILDLRWPENRCWKCKQLITKHKIKI